ncbi:GntR family transcriptional regulator [Streptococcus halotolerans]|uniref:GntR family transcriptional regulator n=1 Tax=Streptococcus halotolerans TaxID=1814128 RepID=UPI0007893221|nr:GntR family transcriptional regulator [Streptococcus halotolerans]
MKLSREPKYLRLKKTLQSQILSGNFQEGDKFHTESELVTAFNVSSITAIRALNELEKEGLVERKQGVGTFVSRSRLETLVKFSDIELFQPSQDMVTVLSVTKGNHPTYLNRLGLHKTEHYYQVIRLRTAQEKPYIYHHTYLPHDFVKDTHADKEQFKSIYQLFKKDFNILMSDEAFEETNEICLSYPETVAKQLKLNKNEPAVLQIRTTRQKKTNRILEYVETYKRWDYYKFKISSR